MEVRNGHVIGRDYIQTITQIIPAGEDQEEAKSVIALYLYTLVSDLAGLRLGEIDVAAQETKREPLQFDDPREQREMWSLCVLEAMAEHRGLTLLGKPGSGKSTFGASALLAHAQAWQGHDDELGNLGETWPHGGLLPIRIILRRFAEQLPRGQEEARAAARIWRRWPAIRCSRRWPYRP